MVLSINTHDEKYAYYGSVLRQTALEAGQKIMEIRNDYLGVTYKQDKSPVTIADQEAENIILRDLKKISPDIPVIAEESVTAGIVPKIKNMFWLVDPLDGTKEFIAGGKDFTVNIALIENNQPTFGIVYAPALKKLYYTKNPNEAFLQHFDDNTSFTKEEKISTRMPPANNMIALISKSHKDASTNIFIQDNNIANILEVGSSLKFCLVAEGIADFYPRFGPVMEWDTAAGHAVLCAAGGMFTNPDGSPFLYNKPGFKNGPFIASGKQLL